MGRHSGLRPKTTALHFLSNTGTWGVVQTPRLLRGTRVSGAPRPVPELPLRILWSPACNVHRKIRLLSRHTGARAPLLSVMSARIPSRRNPG